jgi:hypothetical protein
VEKILDKVTTSHTSFWVPKDMQKKLLANAIRDHSEAGFLMAKTAICTSEETGLQHPKVR